MNKFRSAFVELELIERLRRFGLKMELYPRIRVGKKPDLRVEIDGELVYFEVKTLGETLEDAEASETMHSLSFSTYIHQGIAVGGKIFKSLSPRHIEELNERISNAVEEVERRKDYVAVKERDVVDLLVFRRDKRSLIPNEMTHINGPSIEHDSSRRIKHAVRRGIVQLPKDASGIIVVSDENLWFLMKKST